MGGKMVPLRWRQRCKGFRAYSVIFLLLLALEGCADNSQSPGRDSQAVGTISFSIVWEDDESPDAVQSRFVCGTGVKEVTAITAQIANDLYAVEPDGEWDCWDHQGTISDVPVGDGYTLTVIGYNDDGLITYCAERTGITVYAGDNDPIPLRARPFETNVLEPPDNATDVNTDNPTFSWEETPWADYYKIRISETEDFSSDIVYEEIYATSYTAPSELLMPGTQYWWYVAPVSFEDTPGQVTSDMVHSFTTTAAADF
jgi:hypothetical protein